MLQQTIRMTHDMTGDPVRAFTSTLIPNHETITWKIHNVSELLRTNSWTAYSIPMEVGLGVREVSTWGVTLQARNLDHSKPVLCARVQLLQPQEPSYRRVTHLLRVGVVNPDPEVGLLYHFPIVTDDDTNTSNNRRANLQNSNNINNNNGGCVPLQKLRHFLFRKRTLDPLGDSELGDGSKAKEARTGSKGNPTLWKIAPLEKIVADENDSIEFRVTLKVFGSDVMSERL